MLIELLLGIEEINRLLRLQSIRYGFCKLIAISDIESVTSKLVVQVSCLLSLLVIEGRIRTQLRIHAGLYPHRFRSLTGCR